MHDFWKWLFNLICLNVFENEGRELCTASGLKKGYLWVAVQYEHLAGVLGTWRRVVYCRIHLGPTYHVPHRVQRSVKTNVSLATQRKKVLLY